MCFDGIFSCRDAIKNALCVLPKRSIFVLGYIVALIFIPFIHLFRCWGTKLYSGIYTGII